MRDVDAVLLARLLESRLALHVVVAIGQPEARGVDVGDDPGGLLAVRRGVEAEGHRDGHLVKATDDLWTPAMSVTPSISARRGGSGRAPAPRPAPRPSRRRTDHRSAARRSPSATRRRRPGPGSRSARHSPLLPPPAAAPAHHGRRDRVGGAPAPFANSWKSVQGATLGRGRPSRSAEGRRVRCHEAPAARSAAAPKRRTRSIPRLLRGLEGRRQLRGAPAQVQDPALGRRGEADGERLDEGTAIRKGDFVIVTLATSLPGSCCVPHCPVCELKTSRKLSS